MSLAILCSGQGGQHPDMFGLTETSHEASSLFDHAESWFGEDPRSWVRGANALRLRENRNAQLLCVLQALAGAALLGQDMPERCCIAGYSVGELAAWSVAGMISPSDALALAVARADAMDAACHEAQGMVAIRGLARSQLDSLLHGLEADIAIINPHEVFVVGGLREAINEVAIRAQQRGATRVTPVPVLVASHTRLLKSASDRFGERLRAIELVPLRTPDTRLFSGVDGEQVMGLEAGLEKLSRQISQCLQWSSCLQSCVESGATVFLELGPGRALAEMVRSAYPDLQARSLEDFHTAEGVRSWLQRSLR